MRTCYQSAWTLLDLLMTHLLTHPSQSASLAHMQSIHSIVETQLAAIAAKLQRQVASEMDALPQYTTVSRAHFDAASAAASSLFAKPSLFGSSESAPQSFLFGSQSGAAAPSSSPTDQDLDVLNLVDKLARMAGGRARISESAGSSGSGMLPSLLEILKNGAPRSRVVVLRILRRLCTSRIMVVILTLCTN